MVKWISCAGVKFGDGFNLQPSILDMDLFAKYTAIPCGSPIGRNIDLNVDPRDIDIHVEQHTPNNASMLPHFDSRISAQASLGRARGRLGETET